MKFLSVAVYSVALAASTASAFLPSSGNTKNVAAPAFRPVNRIVGDHLSMSTATNGEATNGDANGVATNGANGDVDYDLLGLPARPGRPLKIAIAGGGVGGLTAALCMLKKGFDVTVYEKTAAFARFGGPIQFASNALSVLKEIDDDLFNRVMEKFTYTGTRTCGIKDGLRADGSFRMTGDSLSYLWDPEAPADWFVKFPLKQCADLYGLPYTGVIDRPDLQEILIEECRKLKPDFIQNGNPVESYENRGKGKGVDVKLADGSIVDADVLVGSDGIWSAVRAKMYNEEIKKGLHEVEVKQISHITFLL